MKLVPPLFAVSTVLISSLASAQQAIPAPPSQLSAVRGPAPVEPTVETQAQSQTSGPESAEASAQPDDDERSGFYMNLNLGVSSLKLLDEADDGFTGVGPSIGIILGGVVAPNLIIHGEISGSVVNEPDIEADGESFETNDDVSMAMVGIGPGVTYYFMPLNIYVGGSVLAMGANLQVDGDDIIETDGGFGAVLRAGKEFALPGTGAITVGALYQFGKMDVKDFDEEMDGRSFAVNVGFTLN